ncbi:MAG TPA: 3-hydroxyacyl-CoA dehydrogenase family protein [Chitinophagaceae bacterium]|nr:3-hydroxyacyl-CoA dehydrogenase family protein [Chitinophagaceae bacterium]
MQLVIVANDQQKEEILSNGTDGSCQIDWVRTPAELSAFTNCDAVIDLLFEDGGYDVSYLNDSLSKMIFVNAVNRTIDEIAHSVIRINGWSGFLKRSIAEVAGADGTDRQAAQNFLSCLNKKAEWVPDIKGFVSPRVISMIINEAYFALEEKVSTKEEIDTAMKLGTNYPYGPFEWAKNIGLKKITALLSELSLTEKRYIPSKLLLKEAGA